MLVANLLVGMAISISFDVGERVISELRLNYGWGEDGTVVKTESLQLRTLITIAFLMRRLFSISYVLYLKRTCVNDARSLVLPFDF